MYIWTCITDLDSTVYVPCISHHVCHIRTFFIPICPFIKHINNVTDQTTYYFNICWGPWNFVTCITHTHTWFSGWYMWLGMIYRHHFWLSSVKLSHEIIRYETSSDPTQFHIIVHKEVLFWKPIKVPRLLERVRLLHHELHLMAKGIIALLTYRNFLYLNKPSTPHHTASTYPMYYIHQKYIHISPKYENQK